MSGPESASGPEPHGGSIAAVNHAFIVHCPACDAGYLLPRNLVGTLGAHVTCPACGRGFDVDPRAQPAVSVTGSPLRPFEPGSNAGVDERAVAGEVLDELAARMGPALEEATRSGRLFRTHGPALLAAYDEYRRRAGEQAGAQAFRGELLRRWHVDLFPLAEARG